MTAAAEAEEQELNELSVDDEDVMGEEEEQSAEEEGDFEAEEDNDAGIMEREQELEDEQAAAPGSSVSLHIISEWGTMLTASNDL
jgi:hypothetical protein